MNATIAFKKEKIEDSYTLGEELGSGQFAVVIVCTKKSTSEKFATKVIQKARANTLSFSSNNGVSMSEIRQEVQILSTLHHDNIVQLFEVFETRSSVMLLMELVEGGELFAFVSEKERLNEDEASGFMKQILEGVQFMHSENCVHLDMKPENIMLGDRQECRVKIIDFGLAQCLTPTTNDSKKQLTKIGGTPDFISPEVLSLCPITTKADMWSIGVIIYVLLSGISPFLGNSDAETYGHILESRYSFDDGVFSTVSDLAKSLIRGLLLGSPSDRLSAAQCLEHPWISPRTEEHRAERKRSAVKREQLKKLHMFVARKRWKQCVDVIISCNRLSKRSLSHSQLQLSSTLSTTPTTSSSSPGRNGGAPLSSSGPATPRSNSFISGASGGPGMSSGYSSSQQQSPLNANAMLNTNKRLLKAVAQTGRSFSGNGRGTSTSNPGNCCTTNSGTAFDSVRRGINTTLLSIRGALKPVSSSASSDDKKKPPPPKT